MAESIENKAPSTKAPEKHLEVELKLAVDDHTGVPDLTQLPGVASMLGTEQHNLSAIYYDTKDLRLTRQKITLRRRTGGADDGWHMKIPDQGGGRRELRVPLEDPAQIPDQLVEQVRAIVRTEPLEPIAQVDNRRVESKLAGENGEPVAEFCDDHVTAWSLLPGGQRTSWREWEVELDESVAGTEDGASIIRQATSFLIAAGARKSSSPSKLSTALGDSIHTAPQPPHLQSEGIDEDSPAAAVVEALRVQRDQIVEWDPKVRADEFDSVHQLRVATREMRSLLETFEGILEGEELEHLEAELKETAAVLGVARDAEVVEERFLELLDTDESGLIDDTARGHIEHDMRADYEAAHADIVEMLNSERFLTMLDDIDELLANPPVTLGEEASAEDGEDGEDGEGEQDKPEKSAKQLKKESREIMLEHLEKAFKKVNKRDKLVDEYYHDTDLPLHDREEYVHDVRKAVKKLRYATSAAQQAGIKTGRLAKAAKGMQTVLGDFQDAVTSRDRIQRLANEARERGEDTFAYGVLYQRELDRGNKAFAGYDEAMRELKKAFKKVKA
ncbi:CYTH and CHAD domain-containing protein [Corynebacterium sp. TA-R-1]|uniref:CYTH and CHAD domain-containing protein n=1 Tax=Corynebacterium stercoris TaxID=2943490 RepID=A0ABT1FYT1_9CORY|nr:CYTH and CHAD domain-containing protein [Corynebacterium stercoris]MCP1386782.1 CYTH and CHAD domain-containing protein [Corynebacterium stercoris]